MNRNLALRTVFVTRRDARYFLSPLVRAVRVGRIEAPTLGARDTARARVPARRGDLRCPREINFPGSYLPVALEPAVGDGARVAFSLPTGEASPDYRWYPKQGTVVGYVNGVAAAVASVDTDARTVTFAAAPGVGATVKATYRGLRLVRLSDPPSFQGVTKRYGQYELPMEEVMRD